MSSKGLTAYSVRDGKTVTMKDVKYYRNKAGRAMAVGVHPDTGVPLFRMVSEDDIPSGSGKLPTYQSSGKKPSSKGKRKSSSKKTGAKTGGARKSSGKKRKSSSKKTGGARKSSGKKRSGKTGGGLRSI